MQTHNTKTQRYITRSKPNTETQILKHKTKHTHFSIDDLNSTLKHYTKHTRSKHEAKPQKLTQY